MPITWIALGGAALCLVLIAILAFVSGRRSRKLEKRIQALTDKKAEPKMAVEAPVALRPAEAELLRKVVSD